MVMTLLLAMSLQYVGTPSVWGGNTITQGFDCSGFAMQVLRDLKAAPSGDLNSQQLYNYFASRNHTTCTPEHDTILFFGDDENHITHVAFGVSTTHMVETGDSSRKYNTIEKAMRYGAYVRIRPISRRKDLVGCFKVQYVGQGVKL